ncbi:DNA-binding transcriptional regulator, AcrR family [Nocardiopsis flavescens]|uniref:DNA-binding transcriptional regulator, AcrR family n=1 Tax=Nocardiopsis flavescens TaxID=758803 RepID=A0A1M6C376_9ACTN|nr:TetR/AcrR family transcriptional regulator [Nocardiopsis flavescens]SHI55271.1 DNA-binding transcriptional regulator, AcrR family [Nocardiopsis flavescens]
MATQRAQEVRERLLTAAAALIAERGWAGVSTRVLAERAGVGPGLVHYHFPSLRELLNEAALRTMSAVVHEGAAHLSGASAQQGLDLLLGSLDAYSGDDPTSVLFTEAYLAAGRDEELHRALTGLLADFRALLADWMRSIGVPEPDTTARVLASAVDGLMLHRPLDPSLAAEAAVPVLRRLLTGAVEEQR